MDIALLLPPEGAQPRRAIRIRHLPFLIGRDPACQFRPASPWVSRRHCVLAEERGAAWLRDLASSNGTFVNGERVEGQRRLSHRDRLVVGPFEFELLISANVPVNQPTPLPPTRRPRSAEDDASAFLLAIDASEAITPAGERTTSPHVAAPDSPCPWGQHAPAQAVEDRSRAAPAEKEDSAAAANRLLTKYLRRPHQRGPEFAACRVFD
jgi:predicted component of type VI protein secretion system